ncbi:TAFII55 protein conserved region-domain-containing protein [Schizophyllum amplum]|uniref:TAFII55 protein conserved region-domain-containing protein n=1 Tax=Schizophyllum amplum TaxID=97359 RepID=A0A550CCZ1_9AGAR|nr:TAFII55 protein conserved region-domain-containing protein [Auriculariopsis ampla]
MDEDIIVVDDVPEQPVPGPSTAPIQAKEELQASGSAGEHAHGTRSKTGHLVPSKLRNSLNDDDYTDQPRTRSGLRQKQAPTKLKLKLGDKTASQAPGQSFLGSYDRELDSDDEELAFEEQFILRMPAGEDCDRLRKMAQTREVSNDVWFKFKDSRRGQFHIGNTTYTAKLVDLPCIIESQKTLDNKQMFKVADICQMLLVETPEAENQDAGSHKAFNMEEFIYPHGITPPLQHVRKRRFRHRVNRRTIESVEQEVERLLEDDELASETKYEVLENVNPDLSDSEFIERDEPIDAPTPAISDFDAATPGGETDNGDGIDEELAAELDLALGDDDEQPEADDEDDEDDDESEEEEDEDEDDEDSQAKKLLNEEIRDLEAAVAKKTSEVQSSMKMAQRAELAEKQRMKKEGINLDGEQDMDGAANEDEEGPIEADGDLFGDEWTWRLVEHVL